MDATVWLLALIGLAFIVAVVWIMAASARDKRRAQERLVTKHQESVARVRTAPVAYAPPVTEPEPLASEPEPPVSESLPPTFEPMPVIVPVPPVIVPEPPPVVEPPEVEAEMFTGYCMKCRTKREFTGTVGLTARGSRIAKGRCGVCGSGISRILPKAAAG